MAAKARKENTVLAQVVDGKIVATIMLDEVLRFLNARIFDLDLKRHPILCKDEQGNVAPYTVLSAEVGSKYIKIISTHPRSEQRSVYCFLDLFGNIYMASTWRKPETKHVRGTVWEKDHSWGQALHAYGAKYIKGPQFSVE